MAAPVEMHAAKPRARGGIARTLLAVLALVMLGLPIVGPAGGVDRVSAAPTSPTDESKVPHYFGPYPNWANSPQVLADAVVTLKSAIPTPTPIAVGNALIDRAYATDSATPPGTLGPVFVVLPSAMLPAGTLQSFETWNQSTPGGSPTPSAGGLFHAYVLRPTATADEYQVVYDSGQLTVPALADPAVSAVATFPASVAVQAGDVLGFFGEGIPVDTGVTVNPDTLSYPASADATMATTVAPGQGATIALGATPGFPLFSQDRTYSFSATVQPNSTDPGAGAQATATVDPKTGGISAITVTDPGSGYIVPPTVEITSPGVVPTSLAAAVATVSPGVISSITVDEAGFGFSAPAVTISGGGSPTTPAAAIASGGVDNVTVDSGGSYAIQPLVEFSLPNLPSGVQAEGVATMDANGVVVSVDVVTPGSGYTSAPTVTIWDGSLTQAATTPAIVTATIGIGQIDITDPGAGYTEAPTVTILDAGGVDRFASATAVVSVMGGVTDITVTAPGSGYLTPGLRKFVDTLSGLGPTAPNNLGNYIPVAVPDTTTYPGTDYYEIGLVQYRHHFHSDLPATLMRGYVQLSTSVVPGNQVPLTNAKLDPLAAPAPAVLPNGSQALGVDLPHYLGPTIIAEKDRPVRILFRNLLPTNANGSTEGNLFLPVDTSLMGSGMGPNAVMLGADGVPMDMATNDESVLDEVRNPVCGELPKPTDCFSENRATLHLHGGITPWISDGTPHQWTTPAGEVTDYPQGVSVSNVPDMPDPGPGALTFFYTNQQSARLMFYHDHAWGITRLNVYAGEAAGYLLTDAMEKSLFVDPGAPFADLGYGTPLVVQDKTFVPSPEKMAMLDPTWNYTRWGGEGNLWVAHVYMPAQNPGDPSGMSSFGRWMYGPWFWPPAKDAKYPPIPNPYYDPTCDPNVAAFCEPALIPSTPNVSVGMEQFNDTPIVNGTAYPKTTVDPKAYRFRILNAANDRFWNLSWYVADPRTGTLSEVALKPAEVAAAQLDPVVFPTPDEAWSPKGPSWVQIGTEGGFLPTPVVVPAHETTWITDPTRFDVGNVDQHSLLLAPAERADVIVDFSQFRGKTLILYNDAPAAFPARVPGYDYYTGDPDLSPAGTPTTLPGYGPNTRTIMQVKVSSAAPAVAFDRPNTTADRMGTLMAAFNHHLDGTGQPAGVFEAGSDPVIVGQAAYNQAYGTDFVSAGWCSAPTSPTAKCDGYARIAEGSQPTDLFKFDTLAGGQLQIPFEPKGIHDEMNSANFDEWGRMTANLGLEAPGATPLLQNIILYPYVNPSTENLDAAGLPSSLDVTPIASAADGTQIWKITHNGVDTHPIHWHLYDVQVINRVTWDNIIIPPEPTELGWKDTVRISPLEDTIVAVRPIVPTLPFAVPDSKRPLNPMMPIGARGSQNGPNGLEAGFNNTDATGAPIAPIVNVVTDFGWEYVFHCHILSHEEMDMMRPVTVAVPWETPPPITDLTATRGSVILHWTDPTPVDYLDLSTWGNPGTGGSNRQAEVGFMVERASDPAGPWTFVANAPANSTTYTDLPPDPTATYYYRVSAFNEAGGAAPSNVLEVLGAPRAPTDLTALVQPNAALPTGAEVALNWTDVATNEDNYVVERATGAGAFGVLTSTLPPNTTSYVDQSVLLPDTYSYRVRAFNTLYGSSAYSNTATVTIAKPASTTVVVDAPSPSSFVGESVTFTATVSPTLASAVPTGTVAFSVDGSPVASGVLDAAGVATFTTAGLPVGAHTITADFGGDAVYSPSTGSVSHSVGLGVTTSALNAVPTPSVNGEMVTFTATVAKVSGVGTPSGSVEFFDGAASLAVVPLTGDTAIFQTASLAIGGHAISAVYSGDASFAGSSANLTHMVDRGTSAVALASDLNPSFTGDVVTFTATVTASTGIGSPSGGTVEFFDGANSLATVPLGAGTASFSTSALAVGSHSMTAVYSGDANFTSGASGVLTQTVVVGTTAVALVSDVNPSVYGGSVTYTATVSVTGGAGTPTGMVAFSEGATILGSAALTPGGTASISDSTLAGGSHTITATYGGDGFFAGSSASMTQVVDKTATTTLVESHLNPSVQFVGVTLTATISGAVGQSGPSGLVEFRDGATVLGTGTVSNGVASFVATFTVAGSHSITAAYVGDGNYLGSTSPAITQVVYRATTTTVTSNRVPSANPGQNITFTATVRPVTGTGFPTTGVVEFREGTTLLGTGTYTTNGRWTFITNALPAGSHTITASFLGSPPFAASEGTYIQVVNQLATTTTVTSSVNPSVFGQTVTFTARVQPNPAAGDVLFSVDGGPAVAFPMDATGRARMPINSLSVGVHSIVATYLGSVNFGPSTSAALSQTVNKATSRAIIATNGSSVTFGTAVTFTVAVTAVAPGAGMPTGDVDFYVDGVVIGTSSLALGQATLTTSTIARGRHNVTATYLGNENFNPDPSNIITQRII